MGEIDSICGRRRGILPGPLDRWAQNGAVAWLWALKLFVFAVRWARKTQPRIGFDDRKNSIGRDFDLAPLLPARPRAADRLTKDRTGGGCQSRSGLRPGICQGATKSRPPTVPTRNCWPTPASTPSTTPLPNSLHAEWVIKAAEAGKHTFCEKPMGDDADQARAMAAACEKHSVLLSEAFMFRFSNRNNYARSVIASGRLGPIWAIKASFSFNVPRRPRNIRHRPDLAGGALADAGCYTVAAVRFLTGSEPIAVLSSMRMDEEYEVDMSGSAILEFPRSLDRRLHLLDRERPHSADRGHRR